MCQCCANISGGSILIEGDFAGDDTTLLRVALGGSGSTFSGVYIPSQPAIDTDITLTFVQAGDALSQPVPEPSSVGLLMAGLTVLFGGSMWRKR